jgi:hypothetical protein
MALSFQCRERTSGATLRFVPKIDSLLQKSALDGPFALC